MLDFVKPLRPLWRVKGADRKTHSYRQHGPFFIRPDRAAASARIVKRERASAYDSGHMGAGSPPPASGRLCAAIRGGRVSGFPDPARQARAALARRGGNGGGNAHAHTLSRPYGENPSPASGPTLRGDMRRPCVGLGETYGSGPGPAGKGHGRGGRARVKG
jgi:hypothetical protein